MNYYLHTNAETACEMVKVTDKDILEWSNGEITSYSTFPDYRNFLDKDEEDCTEEEIAEAKEKLASAKTLYSKDIFGEYGERSMQMGHIALPFPVVNINYFMGTRPFLAKKLGRSVEELKKLIFGNTFIAADTKEGLYKKDEYVDFKEIQDAIKEGKLTKEEYEKDILSYADAVEYLLKEKNDPDIDRIILHNIPVIPLLLRYKFKKTDDGSMDIAGGYMVNSLYGNVIDHSEKIKHLLQFKDAENAGTIIRAERAILQMNTDALINNGYTTVRTNDWGRVFESLHEMALSIKGKPAWSKNDLTGIIEDTKKKFDREAFRNAVKGIIEELGKSDDPNDVNSGWTSNMSDEERNDREYAYKLCFSDLLGDIADRYYNRYDDAQIQALYSRCCGEIIGYIWGHVMSGAVDADHITDQFIDNAIAETAICIDGVMFLYSKKGLAFEAA